MLIFFNFKQAVGHSWTGKIWINDSCILQGKESFVDEVDGF